jgi:hypothetical protein
MILLSALLASLTGLMAGERPAPRAQVELSAVAAVAQAGEVVAQIAHRPVAGLPRQMLDAPARSQAHRALPRPAGRVLLILKQSWLH